MRLLCIAAASDIDFIRASDDSGGMRPMSADRLTLERSRTQMRAAPLGAPRPAEVFRQIGCRTVVWLFFALVANRVFAVPH